MLEKRLISSLSASDPRELDVVTISLRSDPRTFTENELTTIREQLALLLHQQGSTEINVNIDDVVIEPKSGSFIFSSRFKRTTVNLTNAYF